MPELSSLVVSRLGTAEQLLLWALRQRCADQGATTPRLVRGFELACGPAGVEPALASFERLFDALHRHGRCVTCPLRCAVVGRDEAACLGLIAAAQCRRSGRLASLAAALVVPERTRELIDHAIRLADVLHAAGHDMAAAAEAAGSTLH
jgi:hypothetical protein